MGKVDGQHLLILGFASAKVKDPRVELARLRDAFPSAEPQLMRADRIAGPEHLWFAAQNAVKAFSQKYKRSRSLAMEMLLYASCQRQISKAIEMLGVTPQTEEIAVTAMSKSPRVFGEFAGFAEKAVGGKLDPEVLEIRSKRKLSELKRVFKIGDRELEASRLEGERDDVVVKRLVIERSALLALEG